MLYRLVLGYYNDGQNVRSEQINRTCPLSLRVVYNWLQNTVLVFTNKTMTNKIYTFILRH